MRDLASVVNSKDIISTENLTTLFVVVSKHTKLEWQSSYEKFCEFVVSHMCCLTLQCSEVEYIFPELAKQWCSTFRFPGHPR